MKRKSTKSREEATGVGSLIKDAEKQGRLLIGSNRVVREMKKGRLIAVIYASNLPEALARDINHYASVSGVEMKGFAGDSIKLGETCGKPFGILLIGIGEASKAGP